MIRPDSLQNTTIKTHKYLKIGNLVTSLYLSLKENERKFIEKGKVAIKLFLEANSN